MAIQNQTEPNALTMALDYISNKMEMKDVYLNERYGLNRCTLSRIRKGIDVPRSHHDYLYRFLKIIKEQRTAYFMAHDYEHVNCINRLLSDILLVEYSLPLDNEK